MGHADITTTMNIYAEATKEKKQQAMANLNGKISHSHKCYKKAPHCKKQCGAFLQRFSFSGQNSSTLPNNKSMKLQ